MKVLTHPNATYYCVICKRMLHTGAFLSEISDGVNREVWCTTPTCEMYEKRAAVEVQEVELKDI